jgi:pectin methylesterase-like acyl-CoA thioesterase
MKASVILRVLVVVAAASLAAAPAASADDVVVVSSIQAAVDAAAPGDTVVVPPGRYHETVTIAKSGITIRGSHGAVLDASGFAVGIRASAGPAGPGCPASTLTEISIDGLRIENARFTGVLLRGVDGFAVRNGIYTGNEEYAISRSARAMGLSTTTTSRAQTTPPSTSATRTTSTSSTTTRQTPRSELRSRTRPGSPSETTPRSATPPASSPSCCPGSRFR